MNNWLKRPFATTDKTQRLFDACAEGDPAKVRAALAQKPNVNSTDWPSGFTPLHVCVSGSDKVERQAIVRLLHAAGAALEAKDAEKGLTPLHYAALRDKPLCAAALLECGADINAIERNGATPLHGAVYHGNHEVAKVLLQHGADPTRKDFRGNTPRDLADSRGHERLVRLLQNPAAPVENTRHVGAVHEAAVMTNFDVSAGFLNKLALYASRSLQAVEEDPRHPDAKVSLTIHLMEQFEFRSGDRITPDIIGGLLKAVFFVGECHLNGWINDRGKFVVLEPAIEAFKNTFSESEIRAFDHLK